jgi:sodium transport system ATP-binding protein
MGEVDLLSDNITIIHKGKTVVNSTMDEFRANMQAPNLTAEFIRVVNEQEAAL